VILQEIEKPSSPPFLRYYTSMECSRTRRIVYWKGCQGGVFSPGKTEGNSHSHDKDGKSNLFMCVSTILKVVARPFVKGTPVVATNNNKCTSSTCTCTCTYTCTSGIDCLGVPSCCAI